MSSQSPNRASKLEKLRKAVADNPDSAMARVRLGSALLKKGSVRAAEEELEKAVALDPSCVEGWVNLGGAKITHWDFEGCVEANARALEANPDLVQAHYNKGLGHMYLGQPEDMLTCFEQVVRLEPTHPGGTYHLAVAQLAVKQLGRAQVTLARSMELGYQPEPQFLKALEKEVRDKATSDVEKTTTQVDGSTKDNTTQ